LKNQILPFKATKTWMSDDPNLELYLTGKLVKPWSGSRSILVRKGQIPSSKYSPRDVVSICLAALQNNDDPQLDHGAAVVMFEPSLVMFLSTLLFA